MLKKVIRNIRQRPKGTRDGFAFGFAFTFSLMIFAVWAFNLPTKIAAIEESYSIREGEDVGSSFGGIFSGMKEQFANVVESVQVATSTNNEVMPVSTRASSSVKIPSVQEVVDNINKNSNQLAGTSSPETDTLLIEEDSVGGGREVRIITTQSASSASSDRP